MKTGRSLQELAAEITRQNAAKVDYLSDTRNLDMVLSEDGNPLLSIDGQPLDINDIAHSQLGTKLHIPAAYYDLCRQKDPALLAHNVNSWFKQEPSMQMVRTLDGTTRAFLSDRYRTLDNAMIAEGVLPIISEWMADGASVESCELTDRRMYLQVVNPRVQTEVVEGDIVQSGIIISNSETGMGSVYVMPLVYRLVCKNGMIRVDAGQRRVHIGRINSADDLGIVYRDETVEMDDKAFIMKLQDTVRAAADPAHFNRIVDTMREARDAKITSTDVPAVVKLVAKNHGINEREGQGVLDHLIRGEDLSLYGVANAVTRQAQDVESYDRSVELQTIGFNVLAMSRLLWNRINTQV